MLLNSVCLIFLFLHSLQSGHVSKWHLVVSAVLGHIENVFCEWTLDYVTTLGSALWS